MFLLLSTSSSWLIPSIKVSLTLSVSIYLNLSPQSNVQSPWQPLATEQWQSTVRCLTFSLFVCSLSLFVDLFSCSPFLALCALPKIQRSPFHFVSSYLPLFVVLYTHPSFCHSFVSFMCHPISLCLSIGNQRVVENWLCVLSCGVAKHIKAVCRHIWQSQMMRACLKGQNHPLSCKASPRICVYILHQTPRQTKVSLSEVSAFYGV